MAYTARTADYVIQRAYMAFKTKAEAPASSTNKYAQLLSLVDSEQKDVAGEPGIDWTWLYEAVDNGPVTATDTFALDTSIDHLVKDEEDPVRLVSADGTQSQPIPVVAASDLYKYRLSMVVATVGRNLKFSKAFAADSPYLGWTIQVPAQLVVNDITTGSDLIQCPDPQLIAYLVAAEIARNDSVKAGQYNNLLDKAAERMAKLKENNGGQIDTVYFHPFVAGESWI